MPDAATEHSIADQPIPVQPDPTDSHQDEIDDANNAHGQPAAEPDTSASRQELIDGFARIGYTGTVAELRNLIQAVMNVDKQKLDDLESYAKTTLSRITLAIEPDHDVIDMLEIDVDLFKATRKFQQRLREVMERASARAAVRVPNQEVTG